MTKRVGNQSALRTLIVFALIVIISAVLLAGCGGDSGSQTSAPSKSTPGSSKQDGSSSSDKSTSSAPVADHRTPGDLQTARQLMMLQEAVNACVTNLDAIYEFDFPGQGGSEGDLTSYCEKPENLENEHVCKAGMDCAHGDQETILQQRTKLVRHGGFNYGHGLGQVYAEISPAENPSPEYSAEYTLKGKTTDGTKLRLVGQISDRQGPQGTQLITDPEGLIYYWIDLGGQVPCLNIGPCVVEPTEVGGNGEVQSYGKYWSAG